MKYSGLVLLAVHGLLAIAGPAWAAPPLPDVNGCGELTNTAGPFDYRDRNPETLRDIALVKRDHLDPVVQRMEKGEHSKRIMADLDFLLRYFPNHYPALRLVTEYYKAGGIEYEYRSAECYFDRARRFVPDDANVLVLEGAYLLKQGDREGARKSYEHALELAPDSLDVNYNAGLFYASIEDYSKAQTCAAVAYGGGYPLPGLELKLKRAGKWRDPAAPRADTDPAAAAAPRR